MRCSVVPMSDLTFREISATDIVSPLFAGIQRHQHVTRVVARDGSTGEWVEQPADYVDDWDAETIRSLTPYVRNTADTGGLVLGAFDDEDVLVAFVTAESDPMGAAGDYLELTALHVSEELRGRHIGRQLFLRAAHWARERGATKLFLSTNPAIETQRFYEGLGCVDATEPLVPHGVPDPRDRPLEYVL